ncbi:MAG: ABC transporter permease [Actinomycetota bacterium]
MRNAWLLARKDLLRSVRDRSAIAVSIVAPLVLAFILSAVLPEEDLGITYGVVDEDRGPVAQAFTDEVIGGFVEDFATIEELDSREAALSRAEDESVAASFVLPAGLSDAVTSGEPAEIEVIADPTSDIGAPIARSIAEGYAAEINAIGLSVATFAANSGSPDKQTLARVRRIAQGMDSSISVADSEAGDREFDDKTFFAAGMAVFFLFFTTQFGAQSLLRERGDGTLTRLLAAPMSRQSVVVGKALFTYVLGVTSLVVLLVASALLLGAEWGDPLGVAVMVLAAVFAALGVQSLVTTLAKNDEQAGAYGSVIAVTLGLLGGTFFPLSQAPAAIATLSFLTPHAWIMRGLGDLSGGAGTVADLMIPVLALVAFGAITGSIALVRARGIVVSP